MILRERGHRFIIITVVFAEIMKLVATNWVDVTRGFMGLPGLQIPAAVRARASASIDISSKERFYYVVLVAAMLAFLLCRAMVRSSIGRSSC